MMKYKLIIALTLIGFTQFIFSCNKIDVGSKSSQTALPPFVVISSLLIDSTLNSNVFNSYVALVSKQIANDINPDSSYQTTLLANISENGNSKNLGAIIFKDKTILPDSKNLYQYDFSATESKSLLGTIIETFFADPTLSSSYKKVLMTVPKDFFSSNIKFPKGTVDRNVNDTLVWNPDPTNQTGKVAIAVSYYKGLSQFNAPNMQDTISALSYTVSDNGTFVIPTSDLSRFPPGAYIGISLFRVWVDKTNSKLTYISFVEGETIPLLVIDTSVH